MNVAPWSTLRVGAVWMPVRSIQYFLRVHGHAVVVDGVYGPRTAAAVVAWQADSGLPTDGVVGPISWPKLYVATRLGGRGDAVRAVQQFGLAPFLGAEVLVVDGRYGPTTADRVRSFQREWGLTQDGIAGYETWSFLSTMDVPAADGGIEPWPLVKVGATQGTNRCVLAAQHLLRHHGATIAADGIFGSRSGEAIRTFQQTLRALYVGTTVGILDWPSLIVRVSRGATGEAVRAAQTLLPSRPAVDGVFGPRTEAAVRHFQETRSMRVDGVVGSHTWRSLILTPIE